MVRGSVAVRFACRAEDTGRDVVLYVEVLADGTIKSYMETARVVVALYVVNIVVVVVENVFVVTVVVDFVVVVVVDVVTDDDDDVDFIVGCSNESITLMSLTQARCTLILFLHARLILLSSMTE